MMDAHEFIQMGGYKVNNKRKCLKQIAEWDGIKKKSRNKGVKLTETNK